MGAEQPITTHLATELVASVERAAARRGMSRDDWIAAAVEDALADERHLDNFLDVGRRQIAAGEYLTHEQLVDAIRERTRGRAGSA